MKNRIWTYILVVLVFVLPICTVTAMKLEAQSAQSELRGAACVKKCVSVTRTIGRCGNGHNCEGGCGTVNRWTESHCENEAGGPLAECDNGYALTVLTARNCWCDPDWEFCTTKAREVTSLFLPQCVNTAPC